jgi:hypothetical protein
MTAVARLQENLDIYGHGDISWSTALGPLEAGRVDRFWLATVGPDERPHLAGLGARWFDGRLYFVSGAKTHKSRNLERNPACVISAQLPDLDLALRGVAHRVTDEETVARLAEHYAANGWPARANGSVLEADYSAPSAGPPPWDLWVLDLVSAVGVGAGGAMRWHFG